jgi:tetratricopeptide (TPR) repeat protein
MSSPADARIEKFLGMVEQFPDSELPRFSLGQAYVEAGRYEDAERTFAEVARINPTYMMAWVHRAQALCELERWADAKQACEEAIRLAVAQGHSGPKMECEQLLEEIEEELG